MEGKAMRDMQGPTLWPCPPDYRHGAQLTGCNRVTSALAHKGFQAGLPLSPLCPQKKGSIVQGSQSCRATRWKEPRTSLHTYHSLVMTYTEKCAHGGAPLSHQGIRKGNLGSQEDRGASGSSANRGVQAIDKGDIWHACAEVI